VKLSTVKSNIYESNYIYLNSIRTDSNRLASIWCDSIGAVLIRLVSKVYFLASRAYSGHFFDRKSKELIDGNQI
jgi:hypothetical protein